METKSTDFSDNSQLKNSINTSSKTPDTVVIPGMSPRSPQSSTSDESTPQVGFWQGLHLPLRRTGIVVCSIFILFLIGSGLFNLAKDTIYNLTNKPTPSTPLAPTQEQPKIEPSNSPTQTTATNSTNNCTDLPSRMVKAKITGSQVDKIFYQKHPENSLSTTDADRELRQEWCAIGNQLIDKK